MAVNNLEAHVCGKCGIEFAAPKEFFDERRRDHSKEWYCPNGHSRVFVGETEAEKLQRQLNAAQAKVNEEQHARLVAERERDKQIKKMRSVERRVRQGVLSLL